MNKVLVGVFGMLTLTSCGGGSSSSIDNSGGGGNSSGFQSAAVTLSASNEIVPANSEFIVSWSSTGATSCTASGDWSGSIPLSGSQTFRPTQVGIRQFSITCGGATKATAIEVLDEYVSIPDYTFADVLTRLGYPVINQKLKTEIALKIERLCISSRTGYYGEPDINGTVLINNTSVPDYGVRCVFPKKGEFVKDFSGIDHMRNLLSARIEDQKADIFDTSKLKKINFLSIVGLPIKSVDFSNNKNLSYLGLSDTSLSYVNVSGLTSLINLELQNTAAVPYTTWHGTKVPGFSEVNLASNPNLKRIYLMYNRFTSLDVSKNLQLEDLWANENKIRSLDLRYNNALTTIIIYDNDLEYVNASGVAGGGVARRFYAEKNPNLREVIVTNPAAWTSAAAATVSAWAAGKAAEPSAVSIDPQTIFVGPK